MSVESDIFERLLPEALRRFPEDAGHPAATCTFVVTGAGVRAWTARFAEPRGCSAADPAAPAELTVNTSAAELEAALAAHGMSDAAARRRRLRDIPYVLRKLVLRALDVAPPRLDFASDPPEPVAPQREPVPNVFHLMHFSGDAPAAPLPFYVYVCVRSCHVVNRPERLFFYFDREPTGRFWSELQDIVTPVALNPPDEVFGVPLRHGAHRADVVRLLVLLRYGGVYVDTDVLCVRPFHDLRRHDFVLGQQGYAGVNNAVLLARPGAPFARRWLEGFDPRASRWMGFRSAGPDDHWAEMSTRYPAHLAVLHPEEVHVAGPRAFYWPLYHDEHRHRLFREPDAEFPEAYCHHLWAQRAASELAAMTPESVLRRDDAVSRIARRYVR